MDGNDPLKSAAAFVFLFANQNSLVLCGVCCCRYLWYICRICRSLSFKSFGVFLHLERTRAELFQLFVRAILVIYTLCIMGKQNTLLSHLFIVTTTRGKQLPWIAWEELGQSNQDGFQLLQERGIGKDTVFR